MIYFINIGIIGLAFALTEIAAWALHKYIMHGFLWTLHQSHHVKNKEVFPETNDTFLLFFALPSAYGIAAGLIAGNDWRLYAGIGIALYGLVYFIVHDIFIHQRYNFFRKTDNAYLRALRRAHHAHHKHKQKNDSESFGLLFVHKKYFEK